MESVNIFRLTVWIIGIPIIVFLLWRIFRRVHEINQRIAQIRAEEEETARDPYAAYARMLEAQQLLEEARAKKKPGTFER